MKKRGRYAEEFKREVLRMAETSDKPLAQLEQDLGVIGRVNPAVAAALSHR